MRGATLLKAALTAALMAVLIGCHHDKHKIAYIPKEEAVLPPHEDRFDTPPSAEYKKPFQRKDDPSLLGGKGGAGGKMGGPPGPNGF